MIVIDLSKQKALDADTKAIQQINFTGNLDQAGEIEAFQLLKKQKKLFQIFHKQPCEYCKFTLL